MSFSMGAKIASRMKNAALAASGGAACQPKYGRLGQFI
jgi:hypothetical protein